MAYPLIFSNNNFCREISLSIGLGSPKSSQPKEISEKVFKKYFRLGRWGEKVFERMPSIVWHYRLIPLKCLVFDKMIVNHLTFK